MVFYSVSMSGNTGVKEMERVCNEYSDISVRKLLKFPQNTSKCFYKKIAFHIQILKVPTYNSEFLSSNNLFVDVSNDYYTESEGESQVSGRITV